MRNFVDDAEFEVYGLVLEPSDLDCSNGFAEKVAKILRSLREIEEELL